MNFCKILVISIVFLLFNSCENNTPQVLVGSKIIQYNHRLQKEYYSSNDRLIVVTQDSMEFVPLWSGCILSPARREKYELRRDDNYGDFIVTDVDSIKIDIEYIGSGVYSTEIDGIGFRYLSAVDEKLHISDNEVIEIIEGKSFYFFQEGMKTVVSFHEKGDIVINRNKESIKIGRWAVYQSGDFHFLIIDDFDKILKFQIVEITDETMTVYFFDNEGREKISMSNVSKGQLTNTREVWKSIIEQKPPFAERQSDEPSSPSEFWMLKNDMFFVNDTISIYNLKPNEETTSVYVDWACEALIVDYNVIFGIDIDILNRERIKLYPTNEDGEIKKEISKMYVGD